MTDNEKVNCFGQELETIKDTKLKEFAEHLLCDTGDWFYHEAASTTGKYHPKFALGDGGLMRHTRCVVYFLNEFLRSKMFNVSDREEDLLRVAAIAHDIRKHDNNGVYVKDHAAKAVEFVKEEYLKYDELLSTKEVEFMCKAIASHMGIWGNPAPVTDSEKILHLADLSASRREINMEFTDYVPSDKAEDTTKEYILTFGKYKGTPITEVAKNDRSYLEWVAGANNFACSNGQSIIKEYLSKNK